jgi:hypothetical protein
LWIDTSLSTPVAKWYDGTSFVRTTESDSIVPLEDGGSVTNSYYEYEAFYDPADFSGSYLVGPYTVDVEVSSDKSYGAGEVISTLFFNGTELATKGGDRNGEYTFTDVGIDPTNSGTFDVESYNPEYPNIPTDSKIEKITVNGSKSRSTTVELINTGSETVI